MNDLWKSAAWLLACSMFAACAIEGADVSTEEAPTATAVSPLINGTPLPLLLRPEVIRIQVGGRSCTATMISPSTFLTAANCTGFAPVWFGGTANTPFAGPVPIVRILAQGGGAIGSDDMAIGKLSLSFVAGFTSAQIATTQPSNTNLTVAGYGCTTSRFVGCTPSARTYITYFYNGADSFNYSQGDPGAPTFLGTITDNGAIVRVASDINTSTGADIGANPVIYRSQLLALSDMQNNTGVSYRSQVQGQGWMAATANGGLSGTTGQSLRLEGLQVWTQNPGESVCYTAFVQDVGWQPEVCNGSLAGTVGQARRMEAIKIRHIGGNSFVQYRTYLQGIGWQAWQSNNAMAGTTGQSRRIEAIQIQFN